MGETKSSNGVSDKKKTANVIYASDEEVKKDMEKFAGEENTIYMAGGIFEAQELSRDNKNVDASSGNGSANDDGAKKENDDINKEGTGCIVMDNTVLHNLEEVKKASLSLKLREKAKQKDTHKEQENDGKEQR